MPRTYPETHTCHGRVVGFSLQQRDGSKNYRLYFRGPDDRRLERDTGQTAILRAREAARVLIEQEYASPEDPLVKVGWDEAETEVVKTMRAKGERPATLDYYRRLLGTIRGAHPAAAGPADITTAQARRWRNEYATTVSKKTKRVPSPHTVASRLGGLSSLWSKWFVAEMGICTTNPWAEVEPPKTDEVVVRTVTDDQFVHFLEWLDERFGEWELPRAFFLLKATTGCRLADICSLPSLSLREGRVHFPANQAKGRKERGVPLDEGLFRTLLAVRGPRHLWELYPGQLKAALKRRNWPTHQLKDEFSPRRMAGWVATLFHDYAEDHPDRPRLTSHLFRKRAFTTAWEAGVDPRKAAIAIGCNVDTMMDHYVRINRQQVADDVFGQIGSLLLPKQPARGDTAVVKPAVTVGAEPPAAA